MNFNNPIPRSGLPYFHESSAQRSIRDGDAVPRVWQKNKSSTTQLYKTAQAVEQLQRQFNRLRRRSSTSEEQAVGMYPFQMYQSPAPSDTQLLTLGPGATELTRAEWNADYAWRSFRVRAGKVGVVDVLGTDGEGVDSDGTSPDIDPDNVGIPAFDSDVNFIDFVVESGTVWSVWIDCTDGAPDYDLDLTEPTIGADETAPTGGIGVGESPWGYLYVWLGTIDCEDDTNKVAVVRQIRRADIPTTKGCVDDVVVEIPL